MSPTPAAQRTVGILTGAVLLGLLVVLAVALPKADGSQDLSLPPRIDVAGVDVVATDVGDDSPQTDAEAAERQGELFRSSEDRIEELYDAEAAVRFYADADRSTQIALTAIDAAAGPYLPTGPPADPELLGLERNTSELVEIGEATCEQYFDQPVGAGQEIPEGDPSFLRCQLALDEQTWLLEGVGLDAEQAVAVLDSVSS